MVYFVCNHCGESLKKAVVEKHYTQKCRGVSPNVSCMDCGKDFLRGDYVAHTKCISEAEKYSGKDFVPKANGNKGERKQEQWMDIVRSILESGEYKLNAEQRQVFQRIKSMNNVPRKHDKFINFMLRCVKCEKRKAESVWRILEEYAKNTVVAKASIEGVGEKDKKSAKGNNDEKSEECEMEDKSEDGENDEKGEMDEKSEDGEMDEKSEEDEMDEKSEEDEMNEKSEESEKELPNDNSKMDDNEETKITTPNKKTPTKNKKNKKVNAVTKDEDGDKIASTNSSTLKVTTRKLKAKKRKAQTPAAKDSSVKIAKVAKVEPDELSPPNEDTQSPKKKNIDTAIPKKKAIKRKAEKTGSPQKSVGAKTANGNTAVPKKKSKKPMKKLTAKSVDECVKNGKKDLFIWKDAISNIMANHEDGIAINELRTEVIKKYASLSGMETTEVEGQWKGVGRKFVKKVKKTGVKIEDGIVKKC